MAVRSGNARVPVFPWKNKMVGLCCNADDTLFRRGDVESVVFGRGGGG